MSFENALVQELKDDATVFALVSDKIMPMVATKADVLPYIVYAQTNAMHYRHMTGGSGLKRVDFTITYYDVTNSGAAAGADAVRQALDNNRGTYGSGGNTATVRAAFLGSEIAVYEPADFDKETDRHGIIQDWTFVPTESVT